MQRAFGNDRDARRGSVVESPSKAKITKRHWREFFRDCPPDKWWQELVISRQKSRDRPHLSGFSTLRICHQSRPQRDQRGSDGSSLPSDEPRLMGRAILGWWITGRPCPRTGGRL